jgi:hypothetical protein
MKSPNLPYLSTSTLSTSPLPSRGPGSHECRCVPGMKRGCAGVSRPRNPPTSHICHHRLFHHRLWWSQKKGKDDVKKAHSRVGKCHVTKTQIATRETTTLDSLLYGRCAFTRPRPRPLLQGYGRGEGHREIWIGTLAGPARSWTLPAIGTSHLSLEATRPPR